MLEWGIDHARRLATAERAGLEDDLSALRKLIRGINKLAAEKRSVEEERLRRRMGRLVETGEALGFAPPESGALETYLSERGGMAASEKLERLLALFRVD